MSTNDYRVSEVVETVLTIKALLAGKSSPVVGAVLADLLALWLASHSATDDAGASERGETDQLRAELLDAHLKNVKELIPVNEALIYNRRTKP